MGMIGVVVVNFLCCIIMEYWEMDSGFYFMKFVVDKKFKVEFMFIELYLGYGLIKVVGRLKYYLYLEMCFLLVKSGVMSKGLGDMIYKLNIKGMKFVLFNVVSFMNEFYFMLLFEIVWRLVWDFDGKFVLIDFVFDFFLVGVVIGCVIEFLCVEKDVVLSYEKVFGD